MNGGGGTGHRVTGSQGTRQRLRRTTEVRTPSVGAAPRLAVGEALVQQMWKLRLQGAQKHATNRRSPERPAQVGPGLCLRAAGSCPPDQVSCSAAGPSGVRQAWLRAPQP